MSLAQKLLLQVTEGIWGKGNEGMSDWMLHQCCSTLIITFLKKNYSLEDLLRAWLRHSFEKTGRLERLLSKMACFSWNSTVFQNCLSQGVNWGLGCVCRWMWTLSLLFQQLWLLWALTGSCGHEDYWLKWGNPLWLRRLWSRQAWICLQKTVNNPWGRADFPAASSSPSLTTTACAERGVTKLSNNTAGPARTAHVAVQREKAQKELHPGTS